MGLSGTILDQLDQIGDWGLLATDMNLVVTSWNRWLVQHSGLEAEAVVGRSLFDLFPDLLARRLDRYYRQALTGQSALLSQRFHAYVIPLISINKKGSGNRHLQQTTRIVPLMEGTAIQGTLTVIEDVTERVTYEEELLARVRPAGYCRCRGTVCSRWKRHEGIGTRGDRPSPQCPQPGLHRSPRS